MNKFKVGDKIVIIQADWGYPVGTAAYIRSVGIYAYFVPGLENPDNPDDDCPFSENELEFEEVYNSPLYKALNE